MITLEMILAFWRARRLWLKPLLIALAAVAAAGVLGYWFVSCGREREQRKTAEKKAAINQEKGKVEILSDEREKEKENANEAENKSIQAADNFNRVANVDSGERDSDWSAVKRKFCREHPGDSKCRR